MRPVALCTALSSNQSLLGAALAGLLCLAPAGCSSSDDGASGNSRAGASTAAGSTAAGGADGSLGGASDSSDGGAAGSGAPSAGGAGDSAGSAGAVSEGTGPAGASTGGAASASTGGASTGGSGGAGADPNAPPHITSSEAVGVLSEADFKALCDARGGTVELMPHCGGFATAKGFSYDNGTQLLSEHTCAAANTCGGWNCVLTD